VKIVTVALEGLENILKVGLALGANVGNDMVTLITNCGGLNKLEELQNHENSSIYHRVVKMLEMYFGGVEEDTPETMPETVNGAYGFGTGMNNGAPGGNMPGTGGVGGTVFHFG